ncbi:MAG: beta-ketoacyl synthase chain length factor [Alistipes sp.]
MKLYVNCITSGAGLRRDIKELIPEMNLRRRMSRVVKSGVAAGIESLLEFGDRAAVEAVVTATGLGCIADSEKFLDSLIANEERMLNPTPFIQSTFNTVGAQIALLRGLHCYNTTYANRWTSFENALTDAALRIGAGLSRAVLVGAFDETTPSVEKVLQRLGMAQQGGWGESSVFFVLTAEAFDTSVAAITGIRIPAETPAADGGYPAGGETSGETDGEEKPRAEEPGGKAHEREPGGKAHEREPGGKAYARATCEKDTKERAAGKRTIRKTLRKDIRKRKRLYRASRRGSVEGRAIRASQTGVKPHFTAIAEVFRQAVAENAGHKITLYNDFSGRTESAMELTCM